MRATAGAGSQLRRDLLQCALGVEAQDRIGAEYLGVEFESAHERRFLFGRHKVYLLWAEGFRDCGG